ncbi:MAG TPA: transglycosylase domain-containing protein, partial [Rheinheimera sp.]|nr:transglycosylase domain-containing protein [Rheinheimera sp.]
MLLKWQKLKRYQRLLISLALTALCALLAPILLLKLIEPPALYPAYQQASAYFAADGELISFRLASDQRYRLKLPLEDIAPSLIDATLLYEDRRFYQHSGVDIAAIGRAFWQSVIQGGRRQGASTLTMQLARLRFNLDSTSISGKLRQMGYAFWLEQHYSKDELLEAYFNYAPYGGNIEGVAAASLIYFHKEASRLSVPEAIALAVIPQNPKRRSPLSTAGREQLELARQRLTALWLEQQQRHNTALLSLPLRFYQRSELPFAAPHFINQLQQQQKRNGRFYTSLQLKLQQKMTERLTQYLARHQALGFNNASMLLVKRSTLQIQAYIGSANFFDAAIAGQVDGVTALRSPGSALKPFVYALAMQQGLIHPQSLLTDLPRRYGSFNPENFDRQFVGPVSATEALINSRNVPAVQLQAQLGQP